MKVLVTVLLVLANILIPISCQRQEPQQPQQAPRQATPTGRLLRVPRIYNALITTDEELIPSQAYPAVAPVLRPAIPHFGLVVYNESEYVPPLPPYSPAGPSGPLPPSREQEEQPPVYTLQAQQRPPDIYDDRVKNNRNPNIPDVPPPPLPVKPQQQQQRKPNSNEEEASKRRPQDYPPPPPAQFPIF